MITVDYLLYDYKYTYKKVIDGRTWYAFGNDEKVFNKGLNLLDAYDEYYNINSNTVLIGNQWGFNFD